MLFQAVSLVPLFAEQLALVIICSASLARCRETVRSAHILTMPPVWIVVRVCGLTLVVINAYSVVMLSREKTTLVTPMTLDYTLMNPPMPEIPKFAQTICRLPRRYGR